MLKKNDIIDNIIKKLNITKKEAQIVYDTVIETIKESIFEDGGVDLTGFAKFEVIDVPERKRTYLIGEKKGQEYISPPCKKIKTTIKKALKDLVQNP